MLVHLRRLLVPAAAAFLVGCAHAPPPAATHFDFHSSFLLNLHHALYDAARHPGRLDAIAWSAPPTAAERQALDGAVAFYAVDLAKRDLLFDDGLRDIRRALSSADDGREDARGLALPPALADALERAAPAYARCLWPVQDAANHAWIARVQALESRYGAAIQPRLERVFGARFPAAIRDDVVFETGSFSGAYTSDDEPPPQTVILSGRAEYDGLAALEMIWHEAAHAGPADGLESTLDADIAAAHRAPAQGLWHAAQFWAVGAVVAQVLREDGRDYVPYGLANGVYGRGWSAWLPLLRTDWQAWIDGRGTRDEVLRALVSRLPPAA